MASIPQKSNQVVLVGGGFAGLTTAIALSRSVPRPKIILVEPRSKFTFLPLLYELLSDEIREWEIAPFYRSLLSERGVSFIQDRVVKIDTREQIVSTAAGLKLNYSQLVLATGSKTTDFGVPGVTKYAMTFKSLQDVDRLKKVIDQLCKDNKRSNSLMIVGAGASGVELACKVADLLGGCAEVHLIDLADRVLPMGKSFNQEQAELALSQRNVKVHMQTRVLSISSQHLELQTASSSKDDSLLLNHTGVLWTAGNQPVIPEIAPNLSLSQGCLSINECLEVIGVENVLALGDVAVHARKAWPATAQVAIQQGELAAKNVMNLQAEICSEPFDFIDFGEMLGLGIGDATITGMGLTISGSLAFQIRRITYLTKLPSFSLGLKSAGAWLLGN